MVSPGAMPAFFMRIRQLQLQSRGGIDYFLPFVSVSTGITSPVMAK